MKIIECACADLRHHPDQLTLIFPTVRVPMPLTVEEVSTEYLWATASLAFIIQAVEQIVIIIWKSLQFQIGQRYSVASLSLENSGGDDGAGVEVASPWSPVV